MVASGKYFRELRLQRLPGFVVVRCQKAVIHKDFERRPIKFQFAAEGRVFFEKIASHKRGLVSLSEPRLKSAIERGFPVVEQAQPVFAFVEAVIRFEANQQYPRTGRDMAVFRDIDQHFRADRVFNPAMKNAYRIGHVDFGAFGHEHLHIDVLHGIGIDHAVTFAGVAVIRAWQA